MSHDSRPVAYVVAHGAKDAEVQDASHVAIGSLHRVGDVVYARDVSGVNQGSFQQDFWGNTAHHLPSGLVDFSVDSSGRFCDSFGVVRGSYNQLAGNRVGFLRHLGGEEPDYMEVDKLEHAPRPTGQPRQRLRDWKPELLRHTLDQQASAALAKVPGLETIAKKFQEYGTARAEAVSVVGSGLRVSERQLAPLHKLYLETADILGVEKPPSLYVMPGGIDAYTFEATEPFLVLCSGLVSCFSEDEIRFAIGHELGHVLFGHVRYTLMAAQIKVLIELVSQATMGVGGLVGRGVELALLEWARKAEFSCDRVGVMAVQDSASSAMTALMKMSGAPPRLYGQLDLTAFLDQAREFEKLGSDAVGGVYSFITTAGRDHPWSVARASELLKWVEVDGPSYAIRGVPPPVDKDFSKTSPPPPPVRECPRCGTERPPNSSMCWKRGCRDPTPIEQCPPSEA